MVNGDWASDLYKLEIVRRILVYGCSKKKNISLFITYTIVFILTLRWVVLCKKMINQETSIKGLLLVIKD